MQHVKPRNLKCNRLPSSVKTAIFGHFYIEVV